MSSKRASYTTAFKRKAIAIAENIGNRAAARECDVNEANIRLWRKQKDKLMKDKLSAKASGRGRTAQYPEMEKLLVEYIQERRACGCAVSTVDQRLKAKYIMKSVDPNSCFKALLNSCYLFMKRYDISIRRRASIAQHLLHDFQDKLIQMRNKH